MATTEIVVWPISSGARRPRGGPELTYPPNVLTATSDNRYGGSQVRTAFMLARAFRGQVVQRHRLLFDSRYAVPARQARDVATLYVVLAGKVATAAGEVTGPTALVLAEREFERVEPGAPWFRSWGDPGVVFNLRLARADVHGPIGLEHGPRQLGADAWAALDALRTATSVGGGDGDLEAPMLRLLTALHADRVTTRDLGADQRPEPFIVRRLWAAAIRPLYANLMFASTIDCPSSRSCSANSTMRMAFFAARPTSSTSPT